MNGEYSRLSDGLKAIGQRLDSLEQKTKPDVILLKLDHLADEIGQVRAGVDKINSRLGQAEGALSQHETRITVVETFCQERVKPALDVIVDNRVQIAVIAAKWGLAGMGGGVGIGIGALIGRAFGVW